MRGGELVRRRGSRLSGVDDPARWAAFKAAYGAKFGKAVVKITDDLAELLAFYDFPAEHWIHLWTTDEIVNPLPGRDPFSCSSAVAA